MNLKQVFVITAFLLVSTCGTAAFAQDYVSREEMRQIKQEMQELRGLISELKGVIKQQNATIKALQKHEGGEAPPAGVASAEGERHDHEEEALDVGSALASFKPKVSVTGDFVANLSDDHHVRAEEDRFDLRGVDIDFIGEIDGVGRVYADLAYHDDDVELEEAYLIVDDILPFNTDLKLGRFRIDFGLLNTIHPHALPQVDYPAVYREFLGEEGYIDEGVGIAGQFPSLWGSPFEYSLQVVNGSRHEHGDDADHDDEDEDEYDRLKDYDDLVYTGRLKNKLTHSEHGSVSWGLSGLAGKFERDDDSPRFYMEGADLALTCRPFQEEYRQIRWQSEVFAAQVDDSHWERSYGLYSFLDYQFAPKWLAGGRYDYTELPLDSSDHLTEYSAYLTHQYSPNNRVRLQFKNAQRNHGKDANEVFLQWVFTLGEHTHLDEELH